MRWPTCKELGVTVQYQGPATADASQQIQLLNTLIAQKVTGLAISADDTNALVPTGQTAMAACITTVSFDSGIAKGGSQLFIATNQNAWIDVMKADLAKSEYSALQLVDVVYGNDDDTTSYTQAQGLMTKYPDLKVIIAPTCH